MKTAGITISEPPAPAISSTASGGSLPSNFNNNSNLENSITTSSTSAILKEVPISIADIDAEDVIFYAKLIGIDPFLEPHLLWIAQAGLVAPLPVGWFAVEDHRNRLYYYNWATGESSWEHPNDGHYRALVERYQKKHLERREKEKEGLKKKRKSGSRGVSPSSATNSANTTMSGSTLGNLHFFEDDDDDEVFKDLLKPRNSRAATVFATATKTTTADTATKPASPKEDSVESVEFDLENSNHEENEEEGDSIASLEAFQSEVKKEKKEEKKVVAEVSAMTTSEKRSAPEDKKGKEDSDPESDHWNSLPDNELDPFADLFQKTNSSSSETSNQQQQRPMSAKVRPISAAEQQQQQSKTEVINNRSHLRKHLSILEEEDDDDDGEDEVKEDEDIEEVFEDDALEEVNEENVEENEMDETDFKVISNKPALGSSVAATAAASVQMSQMGRINGSSSTEINAPKINGAHLLPPATTDKADINGDSSSLLVLGKSAITKLVKKSLDDFESEEEKDFVKKSSAEERESNKSFQELGRRLETEIAMLKEALRSEMTASKQTTTDLLNFFKDEIGSEMTQLKGRVDSDQADIRFLSERLDQLWASLRAVERAVEEGKFSRLEKEDEKESQEEILEKLLEKALKEKKRLDGNDKNGFDRKVFEEKLTAAQAENERQLSFLREQLNAKITEARQISEESSRETVEELRKEIDRQVSSGQRELRVQFQQKSREESERLRASLSQEMERRLTEELSRRMKIEENKMEKEKSSGVQKSDVIEQQLQQMEENRREEAEQLKSQLDGLQERIDSVQKEVAEVVKKKSRKNERGETPKQNQQQKPSSSSVVVQQCRELQRALHDCALQLNERIVELKLNEDEDDNEDSKKKSDESSGDNFLLERKRKSLTVRHSRSQGNLHEDNEEDGDSESDSVGDQNRQNAYLFTGSPSHLQPSNKSLSKSTPNLCQHCQHQQQMNFTGVYPHHQGHPHRRHYQAHLIATTTAPLLNNQQFSSLKRTERKLQSIRSSSRALIEQIRSTGSQLRAELASLQQSTSSFQTPKTAIFSSPVEQLVILNSGSSSARRFRNNGGDENQPRIFFEGGGVSSDEQSLIRQLRSIRSTVNDRLAKMALVIEGQKTTQI